MKESRGCQKPSFFCPNPQIIIYRLGMTFFNSKIKVGKLLSAVSQTTSRSIPSYSWTSRFLIPLITDQGIVVKRSQVGSKTRFAASPISESLRIIASCNCKSLAKSSRDRPEIYSVTISADCNLSSHD